MMYNTRLEPIYDSHVVEGKTVWQPHVYDLAVLFARKYSCFTIVDVGCGSGRKLADHHKEFDIIGIDHKENIKFCQDTYERGTWIEHDLEKTFPDLKIPRNTVIVCADVVEHLVDPTKLMEGLKSLIDKGAIVLLSTPMRPDGHRGPPQKCHIREWSFDEFVEYSSKYHQPAWIGSTKTNSNEDSAWITTLVVWTNGIRRYDLKVPEQWAR
jgi:SAM-dependent methyltransferase